MLSYLVASFLTGRESSTASTQAEIIDRDLLQQLFNGLAFYKEFWSILDSLD